MSEQRTIEKIMLGVYGDFFTPQVRDEVPITEDDMQTMRNTNPGIADDNLRSMLTERRARDGSSHGLPRPARADDPIWPNMRIGMYMGTQHVFLMPGAGTHNHIVVTGYGVMGSVHKNINTFALLAVAMHNAAVRGSRRKRYDDTFSCGY